MVGQFEMFRGVETLFGGTSFERLKDDYTMILSGFVNQKGFASELTPRKYLIFKIMAQDLSEQKPGLAPESLAQEMINAQIRSGDFRSAILAAGFNKREARKAENNAVSSLRLVTKYDSRNP